MPPEYDPLPGLPPLNRGDGDHQHTDGAPVVESGGAHPERLWRSTSAEPSPIAPPNAVPAGATTKRPALTSETSSWATLSAMMERLPRTTKAIPSVHPLQKQAHGETSEDEAPADPWNEDFLAACKEEYDRVGHELEELRLLIRQSGKELEKLNQRKVLAAAEMRALEEHLERHPRQEIRRVYLAASEAEMRAFMITEQRDQMRSKERTFARYVIFLERAIAMLSTQSLPVKAIEMPSVDETLIGAAGVTQGRESFLMNNAGALTYETTPTGILTRVISAQEEVRRRMAKRLHDGPTQSLANVVLAAEICEKLVQSDPRRALSELGNLKGVINATLQETRKFIFDLQPMTLDDLGLAATLRRYANDASVKYRVQIQVVVSQGSDQHIPRDTAVAVFRVAQEAITNAIEHSRATAIRLTLATPPQGVVLVVEDNGIGFHVEEALKSARTGKTQGISNMHERAEMLGGWLRIESAYGRGCRIELSVPVGA